MSGKQYVMKEKTGRGANSQLDCYPELLKNLLINRGIESEKDADVFLNPDYERDNHNPFLMKDMEKAVSRVLRAIDEKQKILIYSDYDADGIPGGVLLHDFFKKIGYVNFENYIPHRHDEGYGVHMEAVESFSKNGVKLIITVDCGITDADEIEKANSFGMDVIITDHHEPNGKIPKAEAILNPKQKDCEYPFDSLCGSGVVFKLIQALLLKRDFGIKTGMEKWLLDLVGLATLSDMVPLSGENRTLAHYGLKVLRKTPRPGIVKLLGQLKIDQRFLTEDDIGFSISPRINAASRMGSPQDAFNFLATRDEAEAGAHSTHLNKINDERKGVVASIVKEIKKILGARGDENFKEVIVIGNPEWKPSLLGLVANSILDDYPRPIFLWGRDGNSVLKGSCRSDGSVNLIELMEASKDIFIQFGGHEYAGGFAVSHENVHFLEECLSVAYKKIQGQKDKKSEEVQLDGKLTLDLVNQSTYNLVEKLSPYGVGNPKPTFLFENIEIQEVKKFGKEKNHLELVFVNTKGKKVSAISFFSKETDFTETALSKGDKVNLVATLEKSMFRGFPELRLRIVDCV